MNTSKLPSYPIAQFELIPASKNGAAFVREDTIGTQNPVYIVHPKNRVIMNESVVRQKSDTEKDVYVNVPTRYVYGQEIILKDEQEKRNIHGNPKTDKIVFINGFITVPKDGPFVGLYNIMKGHAQNLSNPDRIESLQPIFREVKAAEEAHTDNFAEFLTVEAIGYIKALVTEKAGKYIYNEERIEALCQLFGVYAETPEQKVAALIAVAKLKPQEFLTKAKANEQTVLIEVSHGLRLKLISFEGATAIYVDKKLKIKEFPGCKDEDAKIAALAGYFSTIDGKEAYQLYQAELSAAKIANTSKQ